MSEEARPFIPKSGDLENDLESHSEKNQGAPHKVLSKAFIIKVVTQLFLISLYSIASITFVKLKADNCSPILASTAIDQLQLSYTPGSFDLYQSSDYVDYPNPTTDAKWRHLLQSKSIRVSKEELLRNGRDSVELPGGGYMAWLGLFHELHCVNLLREWKYKEHYFPNATRIEKEKIEKHTDHCLDRIRATLMCHPDVSSLTTFFWDVEPQPKVNGTKTLHNCVDWDMLMTSLEQRAISEREISALKNPR